MLVHLQATMNHIAHGFTISIVNLILNFHDPVPTVDSTLYILINVHVHVPVQSLRMKRKHLSMWENSKNLSHNSFNVLKWLSLNPDYTKNKSTDSTHC